jgi:hypothetical protein
MLICCQQQPGADAHGRLILVILTDKFDCKQLRAGKLLVPRPCIQNNTLSLIFPTVIGPECSSEL